MLKSACHGSTQHSHHHFQTRLSHMGVEENTKYLICPCTQHICAGTYYSQTLWFSKPSFNFFASLESSSQDDQHHRNHSQQPYSHKTTSNQILIPLFSPSQNIQLHILSSIPKILDSRDSDGTRPRPRIKNIYNHR
jgi:hypothetical protein